MSEISVTVNGSTTINPTVGNGDTVNVTIAATGERGPTGNTGASGPANSLSIGTVSQGTAAATITGTSPNQVLNLVLQKGDAGTNIELQATGTHIQWRLVGGSAWTNLVSLSAITGPAGSTGAAGAAVELQASGTHIQWRYVGGSSWTNVIALSSLVGATGATGATGPQGPAGSVNLADETPQPLGTASAGTALTAARADHVHSVGTVTYSSLSGIPSTFAPSAHSHAVSDVTGLQTALDGKQASGTYCPLVNSQIPSSYLPSFVDDVIDVGGTLPSTGDVGKIYVVSTGTNVNKIYRWSGSTFIEISPSPGTTTDVPEGTNLYFTSARAAAAAPVQSVAGRTGTVTLAQLGSSGTASATTFLRGDGAWAAAGSTDASSLASGTVPAARLPLATTTAAGAVIVGSGLTISSGVLSRSSSYDPAAAPGAPSGINFAFGSAGVSWNASPGGVATQYEVQKSANGTGTWTTIFTTSDLAVNLAGLAISSNDKFRVRGLNADSLPGEWGYMEGATPGGSGGSGLSWSSVPASPTASGSAGSVAYDGSYLYVATANGTWARASLSTWTVPVITISSQPSNQTASAGSATFSVTASVTSGALTYQWQRNSGSTWGDVSGATSSSLVLSGLTVGENGYQYRVIVSSTGAVSVTSSAATLTVNAGAAITYANKYGTGTHSVTGSGTITASITGGGDNADTRLWLLIGTSGTLSYTVTASSEGEFDGGRLYLTSSSPASNIGTGAFNASSISGFTNVSAPVSGSGSSTGTVSVTAGQYLVLKYSKDSSDNQLSDSVTATLSIA